MTESQQAFFLWVADKAPYLLHIWDQDKLEYQKDVLHDYLTICSGGEAIMAKFFVSVWCGKSMENFDIFAAANDLATDDFRIILKWLNMPVYP